MSAFTPPAGASTAHHRGWGFVVWALAFAGMALLDQRVDLASQATPLILAAALSALVWPARQCMLACFVAVLAFNFAFVPPRGTLHVEVGQHLVVLLTMLAVAWIVAVLVARQRDMAERERRHALLSEQLRHFAESLRELEDGVGQAQHLRSALHAATGSDARLLLVEPEGSSLIGAVSADERTGLELCVRDARALGPGSGRHEEQPLCYLPIRGRASCLGAALLALPQPSDDFWGLREHAQALCDQLGLTLERSYALRQASGALENAQVQALRNTLLTAIAHDHRTPLATILGAASALHDQADRLSSSQVRELAARLVDEATELSRLSENMLQLARLESAQPTLQFDWESVEELIGSVLRRRRLRANGEPLQVVLDCDLPLVRCDVLLLMQLLDNLIENALRYAGTEQPVEIRAQREGPDLLLSVRDRGPGVPDILRERIFETFQRGDANAIFADDRGRRGAGVGLAVCRAIARAHRGELTYRPRIGGGASFELSIPIDPPPAMPPAASKATLP